MNESDTFNHKISMLNSNLLLNQISEELRNKFDDNSVDKNSIHNLKKSKLLHINNKKSHENVHLKWNIINTKNKNIDSKIKDLI